MTLALLTATDLCALQQRYVVFLLQLLSKHSIDVAGHVRVHVQMPAGVYITSKGDRIAAGGFVPMHQRALLTCACRPLQSSGPASSFCASAFCCGWLMLHTVGRES
jgi:hypothetical protein